jgi:hypothetical protein
LAQANGSFSFEMRIYSYFYRSINKTLFLSRSRKAARAILTCNRAGSNSDLNL